MSESPAINGMPSMALPGPGEVHIWHIDLDVAPEAIGTFRQLLDDQERARADRFFREVHKDRFTAGRGTLRTLLGAYLCLPPEGVAFDYGPQGKPRLAVGSRASALSFNLSHSGAAGLCAVSSFATIGVDIEACRESRDLIPIARRFFSVAEREQLVALPPECQAAGFYHCWTCKEALLKAWGTGLSTPLDRFTVDVTPGTARLLSITVPEFADVAWHLYSLQAPPGFAASLAAPGAVDRLDVRHWPGTTGAQWPASLRDDSARR